MVPLFLTDDSIIPAPPRIIPQIKTLSCVRRERKEQGVKRRRAGHRFKPQPNPMPRTWMPRGPHRRRLSIRFVQIGVMCYSNRAAADATSGTAIKPVLLLPQ